MRIIRIMGNGEGCHGDIADLYGLIRSEYIDPLSLDLVPQISIQDCSFGCENRELMLFGKCWYSVDVIVMLVRDKYRFDPANRDVQSF